MRDAHAREAELEIFEAGETGDTTPAKVNEITAADIEAVRLYYNEQLQAAGSTMPRAKCKLTGKREAYVRARIRQYGMQAVVEVIQQAARSEFLNGSGDRGFVADLEWIMRPNNFPKVYDGKFNIKARQQATEPARLKQETQTRSGMSELLDEQEEVSDENCAELHVTEGKVEFDNVSFSYTAGRRLIENLSIGAQGGRRVAIVGKTGSGKTTLINLLMRFYDVDEGQILLDGKDITPDEIYAHVNSGGGMCSTAAVSVLTVMMPPSIR